MSDLALKDVAIRHNKNGNPVVYFMCDIPVVVCGTAHYKKQKKFSILFSASKGFEYDGLFKEIKVDTDFEYPVALMHHTKGEYHVLIIEGFDELFVDEDRDNDE